MRRYITIILLAAYSLYLLPPCIADETVITGEVTAVSGDEITIDRGADSGVGEGAEGTVYYLRTVGNESVRLTVARVRVVRTASITATLNVIDRTAEIRTGYSIDLQVIAAQPAPRQVEPPLVAERPQIKNKTIRYLASGILAVGFIYYYYSMFFK